MKDFDERLKEALINNDILFLENNKDKYNINHRFQDENNDTILLYSISYRNSEAYKFLIRQGADISLVNDEKEGIIHAIVYSGVAERLSEFIENFSCDINAQTVDGTTPLILSIATKKYEMAEILIKAGADVNIGDNDYNTPLHIASWTGNINMIKNLLNNGANQHVKNNKGNYPLSLAINSDNRDAAIYLFERFYKRNI
jgi:ankyrin repeat protein